MTDTRPRIVFMGTPEFAVAALDAIISSGYNVTAVVTVPDKPAGRGQKMSVSPVKEYAVKNHLRLFQPQKLKDEAFIAELKSLDPDIFAVVAFRMLPEQVWSIPHLGTFNAHAALLPQYRGAAPINHAVINGEKTTGVTTFLIDHEIDTGKILLAEETEIGSMDTAGDVHDRLMAIAAGLSVRTIKGLAEHSIEPRSQGEIVSDMELKPAPKIFPADTFVQWNRDYSAVHNFIRGLSPYPGARTTLVRGECRLTLKILGSRPDERQSGCGIMSVTQKGELYIGCRNGSVEITAVQAEGRRKMSAADFLRGFDISGWTIASEETR